MNKKDKVKNGSAQRAVLRERGCITAQTFVRISEYTARPNFCEPPALAKPLTRCAQVARMRSTIFCELGLRNSCFERILTEVEK